MQCLRALTGVALAAALVGCGQTALVAPGALNGQLSAESAKRNPAKAALAVFAGLDDYAAQANDNFQRIQIAHEQLASVGSNARADLFLSGDSGLKRDGFRTRVTAHQAWGQGFESLGELQTNHTPALRDYLAWVGDHTDAATTHAVIFTHGGGYGGVLLDYDGKPDVPATSLTLQNTAKALAKGYRGGRLASLTLDACMMATIEVGEALKGTTEVLTGSEDFGMLGSTPYDELASTLASGKATTGEAFGRVAAEAIIERGKGGAYNSRTWSALRLNADYDRLVAKVDRLAQALTDALKTEPTAVHAACADTAMFALMAEYAPHYGDYHQRDLVDLCRALKRRVKARPVQAAAADVEAAIAPVLIAFHKHPSETMAHGLAIFLPVGLKAGDRDAWLGSYRGCVFARHTHWDEFLTALNSGN